MTELSGLLHRAAAAPLGGEDLATFNAAMTGPDEAFGVRYTHVGPDAVRASITVGPEHLQPFGIVNGGVWCAIGESLGSAAGTIAAGTPVVGLSNSTQFLASVKSGEVEAEARPIHTGTSTQLWDIVFTQGDKLLARCQLRTMVLR